MREINKIGILIAWPREIDMYDGLVMSLYEKKA